MSSEAEVDYWHCEHGQQSTDYGSHNCLDENGNCLSMSHCMFGLLSRADSLNSDFSPPSYQRYSVALQTIDLSTEIEPPRL